MNHTWLHSPIKCSAEKNTCDCTIRDRRRQWTIVITHVFSEIYTNTITTVGTITGFMTSVPVTNSDTRHVKQAARYVRTCHQSWHQWNFSKFKKTNELKINKTRKIKWNIEKKKKQRKKQKGKAIKSQNWQKMKTLKMLNAKIKNLKMLNAKMKIKKREYKIINNRNTTE